MKKLLLLNLFVISIISLPAQLPQTDFKAYDQLIPGSTLKTKMIPISAGSFIIGSGNKEKGHQPDESPQHKLKISAFWMSAYEVTRDEFDVFYKDETLSQNSSVDAITRPSPQYIDFSGGMGKEGGYPVNSLSQYGALMYCRWLYNKTGIFYRLPTEAEWEYACRAGSTTSYFFGDDEKELGDYAWYQQNSKGKFQKTGLKKPNAWGLYDMLGNVAEWTLDHYDQNAFQKMKDDDADPVMPANPSRFPKVVKGGGYDDDALHLRSATRIKSEPSWNRRDPQIPKSKWWLTDAPSVGFRIIRPLKQPTAQEAEEFFKLYLTE
ncbi:MAG: formylglycine-rating enzyme family protein [Chitinophagaceae bacterium]|nr:formylglycine-rating enzyme family protein [Chitinophagaceae bacterium]